MFEQVIAIAYYFAWIDHTNRLNYT